MTMLNKMVGAAVVEACAALAALAALASKKAVRANNPDMAKNKASSSQPKRWVGVILISPDEVGLGIVAHKRG
jgi:hypothetical protein